MRREEFYLTCASIELRGVEALQLMHALMGEMLVRHDIAVCCTTSTLPISPGCHVLSS
ncbi:hypothetical protein EV401DRAFT_1896956 [Pisolithus croceorrhizus]|nr:hypothetical protein EV401DRAFT_1896956 [Pisolithus croceorrhizus]